MTNPSSQPQIRLTATQPLFRGFREFAALRQARSLEDAQDSARVQARVQLHNDVAQNFFQILSAEKDLENLKTESGLYEKRIQEIRGRVRIGRSRVGEALTLESSLASLTAQQEAARQQILAAREVFAFLTGLPREAELRDPTGAALAQGLGPLDSYLATIESRPDVQLAARRRDAADESVSISRGGHLPSADLAGNYYLKRSGSNEDVNWDVIATLTVPLYSGGVVQSRVRESASQLQSQELALSRARRLAEQEIRTYYLASQTDRSQIEALEKAKETARSNYEAQTRDYRLSLVSNLDVLQSLVAYEEAERAYDRARFNARYNMTRLQTATGAKGR